MTSSSPSESKHIPTRRYGISAWVGQRFEKLVSNSNLEELGTSPRGEDFLQNFNKQQFVATDAGMEEAHSRHTLVTSASSSLLYQSSNTNMSKEPTPNVSPFGSPKLARKVFEGNLQQLSMDSTPSNLVTSGFLSYGRNTASFNAPLSSIKEAPDMPSALAEKKSYAGTKRGETRMRKISAPAMSYRKCAFSNFDMNALGPTSW
ncbi:uncharacterized protein LOC106469760 [Limulus polyphemus]|uniref:Uncharacterized protein LOC106469760 n=1 Tax=Limulus polyphemus TaxID=6850 RepID=A0ABM1BNS6_LIMPO|nr:uncharacterized protein LOC106469760 [Limulus polyphemus]XP_013785726.1 uncharacterized protein LOC106469760 [Limulus polyphemus]